MWKRKILIIIALRFAAILCVVYVLLAMADHEIIDLTLETSSSDDSCCGLASSSDTDNSEW